MAGLSAAEFADFILDRAYRSDGYIMGSIGQNPKKWSKNSWWFTQYSGAQRKRALYWRENAERVWDCQGLVEGYINDRLGADINVYARTNYANWCDPKGSGRIPPEYRLPGAAVFFYNGSRVSHVGFLAKPVADNEPDGDWYVVEARGVMYGVVVSKLLSRNWNRWGLMTKYFDYGNIAKITREFGSRTLRRGDSGEDVRELQAILVELGYPCGKWGCDGDFGRDTETALLAFQRDYELGADGEMNQDDFDALREALDDEAGIGEDGEETDEPEVDEDESKRVIVDISRWNGRIADAAKFKNAVSFAIHRASCGTAKDAVFGYNAKLMAKNGVPFGVYHYLKAVSCEDAVDEARVFFETANEYGPSFWAVDCEYAGITKLVRSMGAKIAREIVGTFVEELVRLGIKRDRIGLYIGHHLYGVWKLDYAGFAFVWIPRYGDNDGRVLEKFFPKYKCDLHQYTSRGSCPGIADKTVDLSRITGSGKTLAWFKGDE